MNFGIKMTTVHMSYRLAKLGELLGFEGKITSYCLRHMVLRGLQADSGEPLLSDLSRKLTGSPL
jgi:hypothetical protein